MMTGRTGLMMAVAVAGALALSAPAHAKQRSAKDQALFDKAVRDCNGPRYSNGARMEINYKKGTYRCVEIVSHDGN
jgi:hypothetical protein